MLFYGVKFSFLFQAQYFKIFIMWTSKYSTLNPLFILIYLKDLSYTYHISIIIHSSESNHFQNYFINVYGSKQKSFPNNQWKSQFRH